MGKANQSAGGKKKAPAGETNSSSPARRKSDRKAELVERAINAFETKLGEKDVKASVGDFVRLLQLQKELDENEPKDVEVTWVEPDETKSSEK